MSEIEGGCAIQHHLYHPYPKSKQMQLSRMPHRIPWTPGLSLPSETGSCFSDSRLSLTPFDPCFLHLWSECVVLCCSPFINFTVSKMKLLLPSYSQNIGFPSPGFLGVSWGTAWHELHKTSLIQPSHLAAFILPLCSWDWSLGDSARPRGEDTALLPALQLLWQQAPESTFHPP